MFDSSILDFEKNSRWLIFLSEYYSSVITSKVDRDLSCKNALIAIDALFGVNNKVGASIKEGLYNHMPLNSLISPYHNKQVALYLYKLRCAMLHGSIRTVKELGECIAYYELHLGKKPFGLDSELQAIINEINRRAFEDFSENKI